VAHHDPELAHPRRPPLPHDQRDRRLPAQGREPDARAAPRAKAHPVDDQADPKTAKVITGITRHVDENSDAANAYDLACEFAVTMGWGYWRLRCDYIREDSFFQDMFVDPVENPFAVYFDPNSTLPDGSDAEKALIADKMRKTAFLKQYPGAMMGGFSQRATGDTSPDWVSKDDIRLAEYFKVDKKPRKLVALSNGDAFYEDELPPKEFLAGGITIGRSAELQAHRHLVEGDRLRDARGTRSSGPLDSRWCRCTA
jgi:hypothetical protein